MSEKLNVRTLRDSTNLLYGNSTSGIIVSFFASSALVFGFNENSAYATKLLWYYLMTAVLCLRLADVLNWRFTLKDRLFEPSKANLRFVTGGYITAVFWSTYSVVFFDSMDEIELATTVIIISSMAGGASTILAGNKILAVSYALILLVPLSITGLTSDESYHQLLGGLGGIFSVVMFVSSKKASTFTSNAILLKNKHTDLLVEKESLLTELGAQNKLILDANATLEDKVGERTREILALSNIDPLTKLQNRNSFLTNLRLLTSNTEQEQYFIALLFIDLDGFKGINDAHGHDVGDNVLVKTADRLSSSIKSEHILCRWGGDEFLLALRYSELEQVKDIAKNIIHTISQPMRVDYDLPKVGATIGIALYPEHSQDTTELIAFADTAMYIQKEKAKSQVCVFTKMMKTQLDRHRMLKKGLTTAIDNDEFHLVYQPVHNVVEGGIRYCEALLRWKHQGELIPPDEFISVAEQHGIIQSIGTWVINKACSDAANDKTQGLNEVSVNVSIAQFLNGDMQETVQSALENSGLAPNKLHLEITESVFAKDAEQVLSQIKQIRDLGVNISIDDFGKDYSSLSLLQSLSANTVKVDRTFVEKWDSGGEAIIRATQTFGKEFNFKVVVEGVETREQFNQVTKLGVEFIQGFYLSKPNSLDKLTNHEIIDLTLWAET